MKNNYDNEINQLNGSKIEDIIVEKIISKIQLNKKIKNFNWLKNIIRVSAVIVITVTTNIAFRKFSHN